MGGISSKELAKQYKARARAEREAGGKISIDYGLPQVAIVLSDETEHYFEGHGADQLINEARKDMSENRLTGLLSLDDLILAQAQNW